MDEVLGVPKEGLIEAPEQVFSEVSPEEKATEYSSESLLFPKEPEEKESGFIETVGASWEQYSVTDAIWDAAKDANELALVNPNRLRPDSNFDVFTDESVLTQIENFNDDEKSFVRSKAVSRDHAQYLIDRVLEDKEYNKVLDNASLGYSIAAIIPTVALDPAGWVLGAGGYAATGAAIRTARATSKASKFGIGATVGAIEGALYETPQYLSNSQVDEADVFVGAVASGGMNGILGAYFKKATDEVYRNIEMNTITKSEDTTREAIQVIDKEIEALKAQSTHESNVQFQIEELEQKKFDILTYKDTGFTAKLDVDDSQNISAAKAEGAEVDQDLVQSSSETLLDSLADKVNMFDEAVTTKQNSWQKAIGKFARKTGLTFFDRLARNEGDNLPLRFIRRYIATDPTGLGSATNSAGTKAFALDNEISSKLVAEVVNSKQEYLTHTLGYGHLTGNPISPDLATKTMKEFDDNLYSLMNKRYNAWNEFGQNDKKAWEEFLQKESRENNAIFIKTMDALDRGYEDVLNKMKKSGMRGSEDLGVQKGYLPRMWDIDKMKANSKNKRIYEKLLGQQFKNMYDLTDDEAMKAGASFYNHLIVSKLGYSQDVTTLIQRASDGDLRELFKGAGEDTVMKLINSRKAASSRAKSSFLKKRTRLDMDATDKETGVSLSDLVTKNSEFIGAKYAKEMSGSIALAEHGIKSKYDWEALKDAALREATNLGQDETEVGKIIDDVYNLIVHRPVNNAMNKDIRRLGEFVNTLTYGASGIPQLAEYGVLAGHLGFFNVLRNLPEISAIIKDAKTGKIEEGTLAHFERVMGSIGEDAINFAPNLERIGGDSGRSAIDKLFGNKLGDKLDKGLAVSNKMLWYVNGMNPIRKHQLLLSSLASVDYVAKAVGKKLTKGERHKLNTNGFSDELLDKLADIKKRGGFKETALGHVEDFDPKIMDDETLVEFYDAIRNWQSVMVQQARPTEEIIITTSNVGSILTKAMQYPLQAYQKQLLRQLSYADMETIAYFGYVTAAATMAYTAKQYQLTMGMDEREKEDFLEEAFSDERLAFGVLQFTAYSSMLPEAANLLGAMGALPQEYTPRGAYQGKEGFDATQNPGNAFVGISPSTQTLSRMYTGATDIATLVTKQEASSYNPLGNALKLLPFNNHPISRMAIQLNSED